VHQVFQKAFQTLSLTQFKPYKSIGYEASSDYPGSADYHFNASTSASRYSGFGVHIVNSTGRTSLQPRSGIAHPTQNLRLPPFPLVHFPKILPTRLSHCGRFSAPLVSARRCTSTTSFDRLMTTKHADCLWRLCVGHLVCAGLVFTGLSTHAQLPPLV